MAGRLISPKRQPSKENEAGLLSHGDWVTEIFLTLMDSIDVGIYLLDCSGNIEIVNRFALDRSEDGLEEMAGRNIFELAPDLKDRGIEENFKRIITEKKPQELTNLQGEDHLGNTVVYNLKGIPLMDKGEVRGVLGVMNDITERRALESQVEETEQYLQSLIDNANDIIYTFNREGFITFFNKMSQNVTGYAFNPQTPMEHYSEFVSTEDLEKNKKHIKKCLEGRPQRFETTIVGKEGRLTNVLANLTPIRREGEIIGVLGIARDITERKRMEAQLLQVSKMAAIGELAAGVAHEINNPVGVISGAAEQIQFLIEKLSDLPEDMSERMGKHVGMIREQAERCKRITQGLLNFARRTEIQVTEVSLARLIKEAIALLENRAHSEKKRIKAHLPPDLPRFKADPHQLEQVLLNIVNNALDVVDQNGLVIIKARAEDNTAIIDVIDNGIGIPEENIKKIFDPFFTTKPVGKGTGLGLSICFGIVQRMNGTISVRSTPGEGSVFTISLPLD